MEWVRKKTAGKGSRHAGRGEDGDKVGVDFFKLNTTQMLFNTSALIKDLWFNSRSGKSTYWENGNVVLSMISYISMVQVVAKKVVVTDIFLSLQK